MQSLQRIFCCSTIPKTGYTSVHSTLSSMQNVTVQFQKYPHTQGHLSTVPFFLLSDHHTARIIIQYRLERQETPENLVPAQSLVAGLVIEPKLYGTLCLKWSSVLELCCVILQIRMQALPLRACISLTSWYVPVKIANATQLWCIELHRQTSKTDRHEDHIGDY